MYPSSFVNFHVHVRYSIFRFFVTRYYAPLRLKILDRTQANLKRIVDTRPMGQFVKQWLLLPRFRFKLNLIWIIIKLVWARFMQKNVDFQGRCSRDATTLQRLINKLIVTCWYPWRGALQINACDRSGVTTCLLIKRTYFHASTSCS